MTDSPLLNEIKALIKSSGPMPVWRYMELCLMHPRYGYYVSRDPLGREGDFTTAPEVSQMFGELLGLWTASVWKQMGSPQFLRLIELGPGRGTMMADALRALRVLPPLYQALHIHLVEVNPILRDRQSATLSSVRNIAWHDSIDEVDVEHLVKRRQHPQGAQCIRHHCAAARPEFDQPQQRRRPDRLPHRGRPQPEQFAEHLADFGRGGEIALAAQGIA